MNVLARLAAKVQYATTRSNEWPEVRAEHLKLEPECQACGTTDQLQVHHILPFHIDKSKELDPANLITLCEKPMHDCHFVFGHFHNWSNWNPKVRVMVHEYRMALGTSPEVKTR